MDYTAAIMFILPQAKWHFNGDHVPESGWTYNDIIWDDAFYPKPTESMLQDAYDKSQKVIAAGSDYRLNRSENYPTAEQQLAIIFDVGIEGWRQYIQSVKDKFPKP